jgi:hypothetical protein
MKVNSYLLVWAAAHFFDPSYMWNVTEVKQYWQSVLDNMIVPKGWLSRQLYRAVYRRIESIVSEAQFLQDVGVTQVGHFESDEEITVEFGVVEVE